MSQREGWGFICLMGCLVAVALSLSLLTGDWQAVGCGLGVILGILSGGLFAAAVTPPSSTNLLPDASTPSPAPHSPGEGTSRPSRPHPQHHNH